MDGIRLRNKLNFIIEDQSPNGDGHNGHNETSRSDNFGETFEKRSGDTFEDNRKPFTLRSGGRFGGKSDGRCSSRIAGGGRNEEDEETGALQ